MKKRKRSAKWYLLFRIEEGYQKVHLYEPLKKYELASRLKRGWKVIK